MGNERRLGRKLSVTATLVAITASAITSAASACPFCTAIKPTLVQQREEAAAVVLVEASDPPTLTAAKTNRPIKTRQPFAIHTIIAGEKLLASTKLLNVDLATPLKPGTLALLFGEQSADESPAAWIWNAQPVNETSAAYFMAAPGLRTSPPERLSYFAKFLEHADPLIAEDAYFEFGHAAYDDVLKVADKLDMARVRDWAVDPRVPQHRRGFYLFVLGMANSDSDKNANRALLLTQLQTDATDFRAGYDGGLAGYLLLTGSAGLDFLDSRLFANANAAHGDIRHALQALRFYHDQGPAELRMQQCELIAKLLDRPEFAAAVITDLARWQHWSIAARVAKLYSPEADGDTRRAIVGYLLVCPLPAAVDLLGELRKRDPQGVADAELAAERISSGK